VVNVHLNFVTNYYCLSTPLASSIVRCRMKPTSQRMPRHKGWKTWSLTYIKSVTFSCNIVKKKILICLYLSLNDQDNYFYCKFWWDDFVNSEMILVDLKKFSSVWYLQRMWNAFKSCPLILLLVWMIHMLKKSENGHYVLFVMNFQALL